ncbi:hypothetical protein GCM10018952_05580 [Streptosporangium vulgare]
MTGPKPAPETLDPLVLGAADTELVALGIEHRDPAAAVGVAVVPGDRGAEVGEAFDLLVAGGARRAGDVQVDAVLDRLVLGDPDEEQIDPAALEEDLVVVLLRVRVELSRRWRRARRFASSYGWAQSKVTQ